MHADPIQSRELNELARAQAGSFHDHGSMMDSESTLTPFDRELLEFDAALSETDRLVTGLFERAAPIMLQSMPSPPQRDESTKAMDEGPRASADRSDLRERVRNLRIAVVGINARLSVAVDRLDV